MVTSQAYITDIHITKRDTAVNRIVRGVLLGRGSKKLFSSKEFVAEEIKKLKGNQPDDIKLEAKIKSRLTKSRYGRMPVYSLRREEQIPVKQVIYLHGGAFFRQPSLTHWAFADKLAEATGAQIHMALYPKTPTNDYRVSYECITQLYGELVESYGAENIYFAGDSCGTSIALCLCGIFAEQGTELPAHLILYSPLCDLVCDNPEIASIEPNDPMLGIGGLELFLRAWTNGEDDYSTLTNPCRLSFENGFPPVTMFTGTNEILMPDALAFAERLNEAGGKAEVYRFESMYHCFILFPLNAAELAIEKTKSIING